MTKCFKQAAGLALMMADELDKLLMAAFIHDRGDEIGDGDFLKIRNEEDSKELVLHIAKQFLAWLQDKQANTTDEVLQMAINFVLLIDLYREFQIALNTGDAVMIECLYNDFLPIFCLTKKKHYVEMVFSMIETLYQKIGHRCLQLVRINRTIPLHRKLDKQGIPMANWTLDGIIELVQKYYHQMKFNSEEGWARHTPHVMLTSKAQRYAQSEYAKTQNEHSHDEQFMNMNDSSSVHDPNKNRTDTAVKCKAKEKLAIANYISILQMNKEIPGRKYSKKAFMDSLAKVDANLDDEDEDACVK